MKLQDLNERSLCPDNSGKHGEDYCAPAFCLTCSTSELKELDIACTKIANTVQPDHAGNK